jgi:hypothetical protein
VRSRYYLRLAMIAIFCAVVTCAVASSTQKTSDTGPKYDAANQVKTDTGTVIVYVGPAEFLKDIDTSFKKGDQIEVLGAKSTGPEGEQILAKELTVGSNTTTLRDESGVPVWSGWKAPKK